MLRKLGLTVTLLMVLAGCQPYSYHATLINPPKPVADFSLSAADGSTFRLSEHRDRLIVLFFGYTNCPDVCPLTLAQLKLMMEKLGSDAAGVQVVFVTVDPRRDSPDRLKAYLGAFNPSFIGLRPADADQQKSIAGQFGVFYEADAGSHAGEYEVMHTSSVIIIQNGALRAVFPPDTSADSMAGDIQHLLIGR